MVDVHTLGLPLPCKAGIHLLVQLKAPRDGVPDDGMTAGLEVETVTHTCRMSEQDRHLPPIPRLVHSRLVYRAGLRKCLAQA